MDKGQQHGLGQHVVTVNTVESKWERLGAGVVSLSLSQSQNQDYFDSFISVCPSMLRSRPPTSSAHSPGLAFRITLRFHLLLDPTSTIPCPRWSSSSFSSSFLRCLKVVNCLSRPVMSVVLYVQDSANLLSLPFPLKALLKQYRQYCRKNTTYHHRDYLLSLGKYQHLP